MSEYKLNILNSQILNENNIDCSSITYNSDDLAFLFFEIKNQPFYFAKCKLCEYNSYHPMKKNLMISHCRRIHCDLVEITGKLYLDIIYILK